jgi:hypothetical protein
MVGLPYPNPNDPLLLEKKKFITQHSNNKNAGNLYYENLCMKSINQSIGLFLNYLIRKNIFVFTLQKICFLV